MSDRQSPLPPPQSIGEPEPMRVVIDQSDALNIWRMRQAPKEPTA